MARRAAAIVLPLLLGIVSACSSGSADDDRLATLQQEVDDLERENSALRARLDAAGTGDTTTVPAPVDSAGEDDPGATDDGADVDPATAVQEDLQAEKITLWALSSNGLVDVGATWPEAVEQLDNCATWANAPAKAQALLETDFVTRVYRIVLDHYCPRFLPLLEDAAPPPVTIAELNATLGLVAVGWLQDPTREGYDTVAAVAESLLDRPLPDELSIDPNHTPEESLRELTQYPGSTDAVREILERLAIGPEYEDAADDTTTTSSSTAPSSTGGGPVTTNPAPVTVDELNEVFGPVVEEWVIRPNPDTYDALIAVAEELLQRPLPDDLTDDDSVSPTEVLESLIPYPGSDPEVIRILDQLQLDVQL